jgi:hypothetical protein
VGVEAPINKLTRSSVLGEIRNQDPNWVKEEDLTGHTDWVRDVAWAPNIGMPGTHIATCSQVCVFAAPPPRARA